MEGNLNCIQLLKLMCSQHNFCGSYGKTGRDYYRKVRAAAGIPAGQNQASSSRSEASVRRLAYAEHWCSTGWLIMCKVRYRHDRPAM